MKIRNNVNIERIQFIKKSINSFNSNACVDDEEELCITIDNSDGEIIGGITGRSYWGVMHIEYLWISDELRGAGMGARLMEMVESESISRACTMICLDTFSFQAPAFYFKLGYEIYGRTHGYNGGYERLYLRKLLPYKLIK